MYRSRLPRLFLAAFLLPGAIGCRDVALGFGDTPQAARQHVNELLTALARRFGPAEQDEALQRLRPRLERAALVPSRIYDDPTAWSERAGTRRAVVFGGGSETGRYRLGVEPSGHVLERPGDYRGRLELEKLGDGDYEWRLREDLAAGTFRAEDLARVADAVLRELALAPHDARPALREALPRTAIALGRLLSLDELDVSPAPAGAHRVELVASLHPERARDGRFARYAAFLQKRALPFTLSLAIEDESGVPYWDLDFRDGHLRLRLAVRESRLVPLDAPPRPPPDRLRARVELTTKSGLFRVGFSNLVADVRLDRRQDRPGFDARFPHEPDWRLPFLVEPLLRGSLRRPFEGDGASMAYWLEAGPSGPAVFVRTFELAVRESWILRWFGGIVGDTMSDFRLTAQAEADRFSYEAFEALRQDLGTAIGPEPAGSQP